MKKFILSSLLFLGMVSPALALVPANQNDNPVSGNVSNVSQFCNMNPWSCTEQEKAVAAPISTVAPVLLTPGTDKWFCNLNPWDCASTPATTVQASAPVIAPVETPATPDQSALIASLKQQILILQIKLKVLLLQQKLEVLAR